MPKKKTKKKKREGLAIDLDDLDISNIIKGPNFGPSDPEEELRRKGIYYITGEIEEGSLLGLHQDLILRDLDSGWEDDIQLIVNSVGGLVSEGWAFTDLMDYVKMDFRTVGMGEVCSLGTCIVANGTPGKRVVAPNTTIMVHGMSTGFMSGNKYQLTSQMKWVMDEHQREIKFWIKNSKYTTVKEVEKYLLSKVDMWMTAEEAIEHGIIDGIVGTPIVKRKKVAPSQKKKS